MIRNFDSGSIKQCWRQIDQADQLAQSTATVKAGAAERKRYPDGAFVAGPLTIERAIRMIQIGL
nr:MULTISPECIES: hypothetical protein [Paenibacillus]